MPHIPKSALAGEVEIGLRLLGRGKVRNQYALPDGHEDKFLSLTTNRVSAFDFVLPDKIEYKGPSLSAIHHYWNGFLSPYFKTDNVALGADVDRYLPAEIRGRPDIQAVAKVAKDLSGTDTEEIFRFLLLGSGWSDYQRDSGVVCGHKLPDGLREGDELPIPLYAPSTKEKEGHDKNIHHALVEKRFPGRSKLVLEIAQVARHHAMTKDILIADGKLEIFGDVLGDEIFTPDSCRFFGAEAYRRARAKGALPPSLD
ncbi:MAG TPA: phosphoribosylaminoimidazolesuccinocarboxamide synthase, partial [Candidatus Paceibacterota bacterium]